MQWAAGVLRGFKTVYMKKSERIYIPYHVNPAVIKKHLARLPLDQLILHGKYIKLRVRHAVPGSNQRAMFVRLYQYCRYLYTQNTSNKKRH
jgi:hypothetical protein